MKYPVRRFFSHRTLWAYAVSPDGAQAAVAANLSGVPELWQAESGGGWPVQRTFDGQMIPRLAYSPDGRWIAFLQDMGGNERYQVCLIGARTGDKRVLTRHPASRHLALAWSEDSRALYYFSNRRDPSRFDLYRLRLADGKEDELAQEASLGDPDQIVAAKGGLFWILTETNRRQRLFYLDLRTGHRRELTPAPECTVSRLNWVERQRRLYFLTDAQSDLQGVAAVRMPEGRFEWVKKPGLHELEDLAVSRDGKSLAWVENRDGRLAACLERSGRIEALHPVLRPNPLPWREGRVRRAGTLSVARGLSFSKDGRSLSLLYSTPTAPAELFVLNLKTWLWSRTTRLGASAVPAEHLVIPRLIHYRSFDGLTISAFVYLPRDGRGPFPLIVWPHGGPEHQEKAEYRAPLQFWANQGFAVFVPNFRGSTGRGKRFQKMIYKDWGGGHYQDILAGVSELSRRGLSDPKRTAIYGGSFGGYTALWALAQNPELWKAGVAIVAPSNLLTLVAGTHASWRKAFCDLVGDPEADREFLLARSPLTYAERVRAPLLLFQGANDPRVPRAEAEQFVQALRSRGGTVDYVLFENEGHGWRTQERLFEEAERALAFLDKHLRLG